MRRAGRSIRAAAIISAPAALPLLARYDLEAARGWSRDSLAGRAPNMWRYRELLPLLRRREPVTLGEGFTPLFHARALGATLGLDRLFIKDESLNPTNSFKARGQSAAITRARYLGATTIALPTAGNAGNAAAAYCRRRRPRVRGVHPEGREAAVRRRMPRSTAPNVTLVDGLITDAGRIAAETRRAARLVRRLDAQGAVPHRRQEDDGLRARRADGLASGPTGSSIRPAAAPAWSACGRRSTRSSASAGSSRAKRPRMVSVQAERCAPIVRAFQQGTEKARRGRTPSTIADGLRVPRAIGDFLILRAVRESGGTALAVTDDAMVDGMLAIGKHEGVSAAPEGGAALVAIQRLVDRRHRSSRTSRSCSSIPAAR